MLHIRDEEVDGILNWPDIIDAVKSSLVEVNSISSGSAMPPRITLQIPEKRGKHGLMPAYSKNRNLFTCKFISVFPENPTKYALPVRHISTIVFDSENGCPLAIVESERLTTWRTAAGSIAATQHLLSPDRSFYGNKILAVLGAGAQAKYHILGFHNTFNFNKIRLWNRTANRRIKLSFELKEKHNIPIEEHDDIKNAVRNADVIICAFEFCKERLLAMEDLKPGSLIVFLGFPSNGDIFGLADEIYKSSFLFTEDVNSITAEMRVGIERLGLKFENIGGGVSDGMRAHSDTRKILLYQSLGVGLMDNAAAKLVLDKYRQLKMTS